MRGLGASQQEREELEARRQRFERERRVTLAATGALALVFAALVRPARAAGPAEAPELAAFDGDPYRTMSWPDMRRDYLGGQRAVFDDRVRVEGPAFAVDPMTVPVTVSVDGLTDVRRVIVLVDRNPIRKVLEYEPLLATPTVSFRFKLEQASPVRAAVQTGDGLWHVGGALVDSAGGGCTVPGATRKDGSWAKTLGQVRGRVFDAPSTLFGDGGPLLASTVPAAGAAPAPRGSTPVAGLNATGARLRLHLMHPMDTGLVGGIPAFYLSRLEVRDALDRELLRLQTYEPVSENPVFSFDFRERPPGPLRVRGRDNNGNRIDATVAS